MTFIDTHTHLYDEQFAEDIDNVIEKAIQLGVTQMYMPNCNSETIDGMMQLAKKWPDNCIPMMGLHPCYVKGDYQQELSIVSDQLSKAKFAAIGEIGLDYHWDLTFKEQQIEAFEYQIDLALKNGLPIVIHSRSSTQDCIDIVRKKQNGSLKGVFHCFGGTLEEAQQITEELGFMLGIGGVVTFKNSKLGELLKHIDKKYIVLETDAPYLAPTPYRGKRNESSYIPVIAEKMIDIMQVSLDDVANITTENARKLFS